MAVEGKPKRIKIEAIKIEPSVKIIKPKEEKKEDKKIKQVKSTEAIIVRTRVDKILNELISGEKTINELSQIINVEAKKIEEWCNDLSDAGLISINYPTNPLMSPKVKLLKQLPEIKFIFSTGKELMSYTVISDKVPTKIRILDVGLNVRTYEAIVPLVDHGTEAIIKKLMVKISEEVDVTSEELLDPRMMEILKKKFLKKAIEEINKKFPQEDDSIKEMIAGIIIHKMYGLKEIELLMADDFIEEVTINGSDNPIAVYHKKFGWCITNLAMNNEEEILNLASSIGRKVGKNISIMNPLLDAHLISGDRVQATLFPISSNGNTITIRRFSRNPWTVTQYINNHTMNSEVGALLWLAIQYELSILIGGGTASGKTSCLNALTSLIPSNQRVISIEDVREINLPKQLHWNWVPLTVRENRSEGAGNISMLNLMISSLRMRPDRIIVGEVRKKRQAEVLFEAIHTGHSVYTTLHADNAEQAYIRLVEDPISIPKAELEGLHLIVIMFRDRRTGVRRLFQVAELMPVAGDVGERDIKINLLYRWNPKTDDWDKFQDSERIINEIALHTGMSADDISNDLDEKKLILDWMAKKGVTNINEFGQVINEYYRNPERVIKLAKKNKSPGVLF